MKIGNSAAAVLLLLGAAAEASDETVQFSSGDNRVALVELFTSEGCSSCPPADRWLSGLKHESRLWHDYVPIAFHVDYWDYIGWPDPFASSANSERHRRHQQQGGSLAVYTPGFFNNGQEWLEWRTRGSVAGNKLAPAGNLTLRVEGNTVAVRFENDHFRESNLIVHIAVLGMNLESNVRAGENRGRILKHDFVAMTLVSAALEKSPGGFRGVARISLSGQPAIRKALVAWVSSDRAQAPLQAVGGYLPEPDPS